ncbi:MAG: indole-3-glycerol phosphate synthase TrpC [Actinobacteria bacterium]|nr:indole-3-glycerol phosphate synthase TrpC [Actinomycetota bacterium]
MSFLEDILNSTRGRIDELEERVTEDALEERIAALPAPRGFAAALDTPGVAVIAEIKRTSPSAGDLDRNLNAGEMARAYADGGAAAISVLTEPDHFNGSREDLEAALTVGVPVLRKDFIIDELQVLESRAWGADAVLLIVRCVGDRLDILLGATRALGMDALVEVFDERDLEVALGCGATVIGVNHRDLETFEVDPDRTAKLAPQVPNDVLLVGLSGVKEPEDVVALGSIGARAVLVGEALVTADDPAAELRRLRGSS